MRRGILGLVALVVAATSVASEGAIVLNPAPGASASGQPGGEAAPPSCSKPPAALGKYQPSPPGRELPTAPWVDEAGAERPVTELRGKGLVLNFWATWCAPCVKEMPSLDRLAGEAAARGFRVVALSADREGAPVVRRFFDVNGIGRLAVDIDKSSRVSRATGIDGLPTTILYDPAGREIGRVRGGAEWDAQGVVAFLGDCLGATR